jgi:hypothetical protein
MHFFASKQNITASFDDAAIIRAATCAALPFRSLRAFVMRLCGPQAQLVDLYQSWNVCRAKFGQL